METITATIDDARKLFVSKQHLAGSENAGSFNERLTRIIRDVGYIQWDPVTVVAVLKTL